MFKYFIAIYLILFSIVCFSQEIGDFDYVFTSLIEVEEHPSQVVNLDLSGNKLEEIPELLFELENLEALNLSKNKISLLPSQIERWAKLKSLNLSKNNISTLPPQIGKLKELIELDVSKNAIRSLPKEIGDMEKIEALQLWNNDIVILPASIQNLKRLQTLNLRGMSIDDENEAQLKLWLPETNIYYSYGCDCNR